VVGAEQVVVDGLGNAHDAALVARLLHISADLAAGIHGFIAAVIEKVAHVILLENFKNAPVIAVVPVRVGQLVPAGAQRRGGGVLKQLQLCRILFAHIVKLIAQHPLMPCAAPSTLVIQPVFFSAVWITPCALALMTAVGPPDWAMTHAPLS
jgi:hypothetical protein